jgi:hypothetical protein
VCPNCGSINLHPLFAQKIEVAECATGGDR